jgi:hypothetical protein
MAEAGICLMRKVSWAERIMSEAAVVCKEPSMVARLEKWIPSIRAARTYDRA